MRERSELAWPARISDIWSRSAVQALAHTIPDGVAMLQVIHTAIVHSRHLGKRRKNSGQHVICVTLAAKWATARPGYAIEYFERVSRLAHGKASGEFGLAIAEAGSELRQNHQHC